MEDKTTPAEARTGEFREGLDRDYVMAISGVMPEAALGELPRWAWISCTATLALLTLVLIRFG